MEITDVRISLLEEGQIRAFASITFDRCFTVRGVQLLATRNGYSIRMPTFKGPDGKFREIAYPLNAKTRKVIEEKVIAEYRKVMAQRRR